MLFNDGRCFSDIMSAHAKIARENNRIEPKFCDGSLILNMNMRRFFALIGIEEEPETALS